MSVTIVRRSDEHAVLLMARSLRGMFTTSDVNAIAPYRFGSYVELVALLDILTEAGLLANPEYNRWQITHEGVSALYFTTVEK